MSLMPALFSVAAVVTMTEIAIKFEKAIPAIGSPGHEPWPEDGEEAAQQRGSGFSIGVHFCFLNRNHAKNAAPITAKLCPSAAKYPSGRETLVRVLWLRRCELSCLQLALDSLSHGVTF